MVPSPLDELNERLIVIEELAARTYGTNDIEHLLYDLLQFLKKNPGAQPEFEEALNALLDRDPIGAYEVIGFTMHALRWKVVKAHVEAVRNRDVGTSAIRAAMRRSNYDRLLTAFTDNWEDRDLYEYYRNPEMFQ